MKKALLITILSIIFIPFNTARSQAVGTLDLINIVSTVDYPKPGQEIEIYVESFYWDLNASSIVWTVNGKNISSGVGKTKIKVNVPQTTIPLNIMAVVKTPTGAEFKKYLTLRSSDIDIIVETSGYTPPFFKGKIPFAYQNSVKLTAVPHISDDGNKEIDPSNLVYQWKNNGKYIDDGQGYGVQSVIIPYDDIPRPLKVTVEINNRAGNAATIGRIDLEPTTPSISFYEEDPLYGIMTNREIASKINLQKKEIKIISVPYGFNSVANIYTWLVNYREQPDLARNRGIVLRRKSDEEGRTDISLDIRSNKYILQGASNSFLVHFTKDEDENSNDIIF